MQASADFMVDEAPAQPSAPAAPPVPHVPTGAAGTVSGVGRMFGGVPVRRSQQARRKRKSGTDDLLSSISTTLKRSRITTSPGELRLARDLQDCADILHGFELLHSPGRSGRLSRP